MSNYRKQRLWIKFQKKKNKNKIKQTEKNGDNIWKVE